jgi:aspartate-semialdehyde dehydrogenase
MLKAMSLGIVGGSGLVGGEVLARLSVLECAFQEVRIFGTEQSQGELFRWKGDELEMEVMPSADELRGFSLLVLSCPRTIARALLDSLGESRPYIIDLTGTSEDLKVGSSPLIVAPHLFPSETSLSKYPSGTIFTVPSPTSMLVAPFIDVCRSDQRIDEVIVSSYHSVSGLGTVGIDELSTQVRAIFNHTSFECDVFPSQIAFNSIPFVGPLNQARESREEERTVRGCRALLNDESLSLLMTSVRVPIFHGIGATVWIKTEKPLSLDLLREKIKATPYFDFDEDRDEEPGHLTAAQDDLIYIARLRSGVSNSLWTGVWLVSENTRLLSAFAAAHIINELALASS